MSLKHYPSAPADSVMIKPSAEFKKEAVKVTGSILLFFVVYILLMIASVLLAIVCGYGGIAIIAAFPRFYTLLAGVGLMGVGVSIVFFLIKFIFSSAKNEDENRIQIFEKDQPELFDFIRQLARDTNTNFPKKIYLSPEVNASVFYNSSFWSMFFPVRKNLVIGLGLVNSVNLSEFKAIMAHEFGHFSQQSMKLGSFTYNVNRVIYNMLYENTGYQNFLNTWGGLHGILSIFAQVTVGIANAIQSILKGMYQLINKNYLGLSRQMEFNADAIAASVAGGNNLVSSLYRLELCNSSYNVTIQKANELLKENLVSKNIYRNQNSIMHSLAKQLSLPLEQGLPQVTSQFFQSFNKSRINYKDQWSSHPTNQEREVELLHLNINTPPDSTSAWVVFKDKDSVQQQMTQHVYREVKVDDKLSVFDNELFEERYAVETQSYKLPEVFKNYYSGRLIDVNDWKGQIAGEENVDTISFNDLLNDETSNLPDRIKTNEADIEILQAIIDKRIDVKSFDFEGDKYDRLSAPEIKEKLEAELKDQKAKMALLDETIYQLCFKYAVSRGEEFASTLNNAFMNYKKKHADTEDFFTNAINIIDTINPFYAGGLTIEQVDAGVASIKQNYEIKLKARLRELLANESLLQFFSAKLLEKMKAFEASNYLYFANNDFENDGLDALYSVCTETSSALADVRFAAYKTLLIKQAEVIESFEHQLKVA